MSCRYDQRFNARVPAAAAVKDNTHARTHTCARTDTNTHTHTDEQWYWYGSGFPPCSRINHLKGSLLSGPFLLFLSLLPPLLHLGPFGPKYSNSETTSGKKKRCLRALWQCTEPEERRFNCGRTFPQTTQWLET